MLNPMERGNLVKRLEGKQTIETIASALKVKQGTAANIISKLRGEGYLKTQGGGKQKRIYTISQKKFVKGEKNLFDIINKYSKFKLAPTFKHEIFGKYSVENALVDAILTRNFRIIFSSLYLFNHIRNWTKLHKIAKSKNVERELGALYDVSRTFIRTRKMPSNIRISLKKEMTKKKIILKDLKTNSEIAKKVEREWNIIIPFSKQDLEELK